MEECANSCTLISPVSSSSGPSWSKLGNRNYGGQTIAETVILARQRLLPATMLLFGRQFLTWAQEGGSKLQSMPHMENIPAIGVLQLLYAEKPPRRVRDQKDSWLSVHHASSRWRSLFLALIASMAKRRGFHQGDGHMHSD